MNCENIFCIYCEDGKCKLENISLDIQGSCQECIYVDISEDLLKDLKKNSLEKIFREQDGLVSSPDC